MVGSSDVHSQAVGRIDTINVWERTKEATVMCHKCWLVARDKMIVTLRKMFLWMESPLAKYAENQVFPRKVEQI